jgi:hypothetical protein
VIGDDRTRLAMTVLQLRRSRSDFLPKDLFSDPAWDLLLELFVADARGQRLTASTVCERYGISPNVMSRWLIHLTRLDLLVGDGNGNLEDLLTLSGKAMANIEQLLGHACDPAPRTKDVTIP